MNREPLARGPVQGVPNPQRRLGVALFGLAVGFGVLFLLSFGPSLLRTTDDEACVNRSEANAYNDRASQAVDDNAPDAEVLVNMAKMFASEEIMKVAQHAVELHGGNGIMLDFGIEKVLRDAVIFLHMDATADISKLKIIKNMFPETAGKYAGPED